MPYVVEKIGRYKGKLLTCQRRLINLTTGQSLGATDIVHALDAALYNIICNPQSPCPLFDPGGRTASQVSHYLDQIMQTKHTSSGEKRPRVRKRKSLRHKHSTTIIQHLQIEMTLIVCLRPKETAVIVIIIFGAVNG
jgi:hypothetical protein